MIRKRRKNSFSKLYCMKDLSKYESINQSFEYELQYQKKEKIVRIAVKCFIRKINSCCDISDLLLSNKFK